SNIEQRTEQEIEHEAEHEEIEHKAEYEEIEHEAEQEIDNEKIVPIKNIPRKKFKEVALNYSSSENDNESEQENNLFSIKDTGLLDNIELEDSDEEEITFTLPYTAITTLLIFIKALVFEDDSKFPETLYKAKSAMSFKKPTIQFAICEKCHYLTNIESISDNSQQTNCNE
ncbi:2551_t:CDS:2, partial [Cetraspora pellucida]